MTSTSADANMTDSATALVFKKREREREYVCGRSSHIPFCFYLTLTLPHFPPQKVQLGFMDHNLIIKAGTGINVAAFSQKKNHVNL